MPRADLIQTNMTSGELSPEIALGRPDVQKYTNGLTRAENVVLTIQGGAKRRPGTLYVGEVRDSSKLSRLIDFIYNRSQAYVIEMADGFLRFYRNRALILNGSVAYEIASPYASTILRGVNYVQKADTAFFTHESVYPQRLQRFADNQWFIGPAPFNPDPVAEQGAFPSTTLTLGAAGIGATTATAGAPVFYASDIGRSIAYFGGLAVISGFVSTTQVNINVVQPFSTTALPAFTWNLGGSPRAAVLVVTRGSVGDQASISHADAGLEDPPKTVTASGNNVAGYTDVQIMGHGYATGDTVRISNAEDAGAKITAADGYYVVTVLDANLIRIAYTGQLFSSGDVRKVLNTAGAAVWRAEDVGKIVSIGGGSIRITTVASASTVLGVVLTEVETTETAVQPDAWTLESAAWSARTGYPRAVTIDRQRLYFAGTPTYPQTVWASAIAGYLDFAFSLKDDSAFRFELDGARNSPIQHLAPSRKMLVLTDTDEMSLQGGQEKPITPSNIQKADESTAGTGFVRPLKVGSEILTVQPSGKTLSAVGYRYDIDGFAAPDRTVFASHITRPGLVDLTYRRDPDHQILAVRTDGVIAFCAYDIEQEVNGWGRWGTDGAFESVATIPTATSEDTYVIVRRTINGQTKRYIEVFDLNCYVDCGVMRDSANPAGDTVWTGLAHLEGKTVVVNGDGADLGRFTVAGGQITLPSPIKKAQIGLSYIPLVEPLQIEMATGNGTSQGKPVSMAECMVRVLDTTGAVINGQHQEWRKFDNQVLDLPPPVQTGDLRVVTLQDQIYKTKLVISQPSPLPFHLLDIIRRVTVNG